MVSQKSPGKAKVHPAKFKVQISLWQQHDAIELLRVRLEIDLDGVDAAAHLLERFVLDVAAGYDHALDTGGAAGSSLWTARRRKSVTAGATARKRSMSP